MVWYHSINGRVRIRIDEATFLGYPCFTYQYRIVFFRAGPLRLRRWVKVNQGIADSPKYPSINTIVDYFRECRRLALAEKAKRRIFIRQYSN